MAVEWFVQTADKQVGPLSGAQLKDLADRKRITPQTPIRRGDRSDWVPAGSIRDLFGRPPVLGPTPQPDVRQPDLRPASPTQSNPPDGTVLRSWLMIAGGGLAIVGVLLATGMWLMGGSKKDRGATKKAVAQAAPSPDQPGPPVGAVAPAAPPPPKPKAESKLSAAYRKAAMFNQHGLDDLAKAELIEIVMGSVPDHEKAKAYYLLGSIAYGERRIGTALSTWRDLVANYPDSQEAVDVKDRIAQLAEMAGENAKESTNNAVAESYLRHANFWSEGRDKIFSIDTSWIPNVESAVKWYDKIISEFPGSAASRIAHEQKLFTLLGWKDRRYDTIRFGLAENFANYMPKVQEALAAFEQEHPNASAIQAFRFQIAQAYWSKDDSDNAKIWLGKIIAAAGEADTFYSHLAKERLLRLNRR
jgi:TolA-binding protein